MKGPPDRRADEGDEAAPSSPPSTSQRHTPPAQSRPGNRRDNSYERRRKREKPLLEWSREVEELEREVRAELTLEDDAVVPAGALVLESVRLADAWAVPGMDVVLPGNRPDLVRRWLKERLSGRGATQEDWELLAREVAPLPDEHLSPFFDLRRRRLEYHSDDDRQDDITKAAKSVFKAKPKQSRPER